MLSSPKARLLERQGHKVIHIVASNHELDVMPKPKFLRQVKDISIRKVQATTIQELLRAEKPDIVHIHNTFMVMSPSAYEACREEECLSSRRSIIIGCYAPVDLSKGRESSARSAYDGNLWRGVRHGCYRDSSAMTSVVALMTQVHPFQGTWNRSINSYIALTNLPEENLSMADCRPTKFM